MEVRRIDPAKGFLNEIRNIKGKVTALETKPSGNIVIRETLSAEDTETGVTTVLGQLPDGSIGFQPFIGDVTPPPVATHPTVSAEPGTFVVSWDGSFFAGEAQPRDFEQVNVIGRVYETPTVHHVGIIRKPGEPAFVSTDVARPGTVWEFALESEDYNGNKAQLSLWSAPLTMIDAISSVDVAWTEMQEEVAAAKDLSAVAQESASTAQSAAEAAARDALAAADLAAEAGKGNIIFSDTAPTDTASITESTLWIDISGTPPKNTPNRWDGKKWVAITDTAATAAATKAAEAEARANAAETSAVAAAKAAGLAQTAADGKNKVWYLDKAPAGNGHTANDIWFDAANGNRPMRWNGSAWVTAQDASIAAAKTVADSALTSANGKNKTYYQSTKPTGGTYVIGDTWFDTANAYALYTYTAPNVWTKTQDAAQALADAKTDATSKANAAKAAAITAAAEDAKSKADAAQAAAITAADTAAKATAKSAAEAAEARVALTAAADATKKASDAQAAALAAAKTYADTQASGAQGAALEAAKADATSKANAAKQAAIDAAALDATAKAEAAEAAAAEDAKTKADKALADAKSDATAKANAAQAAAATDAKNKADQALLDAKSDTTTRLAGKTKTWIQAAQPSNTGNITGDTWIDSDAGNKLYVWNGAAWVTAQDTAIATAQSAAGTALTAANGKNKIIFNTTDATGTTGYVAGDLWMKRNSTTGVIIGQWEFTASNKWEKRTVGEEVIGNLSAGKITSGTIAADRIGANTISVEKLLVTSTDNLVYDANHADRTGVAWTTGYTGAYAWDETGGRGGTPALKITLSATQQGRYNASNTPVTGGSSYRVLAWVFSTTEIPAKGLAVYARQRTASGGTTYSTMSVTNNAPIPANEWFPFTSMLTLREDAVAASFGIYSQGIHTTGTLWVDYLSATRAANAELLVDGSIKAGSAVIANGAIGTAQIGDAQITSALIKDAAITNAKINDLHASKINAGTIGADRLVANDIRAKIIAADDINAVDIIASNSITATNGIIGSIDAAKISVGTLDAARIAAQSLTAEKVVIGQGANLITDPSFVSAESNAQRAAKSTGTWTFGVDASTKINCASTTTTTTNNAFIFSLPTTNAANVASMVPVVPGEKYLMSASTSTNVTAGVRWNVYVWKADGAVVYNVGSPTNTATGRRTIEWEYEIPADAVAFSPVLSCLTSGVNWVVDAGAMCVKKTEGRLIVDGAITSKKLETDLVLTTKIIAGDPTGVRAEMAPEGFKVFGKASGDTTSTGTYEIVRLGVADTNDMFAIADKDGITQASISETGIVSGKQVYASQDIVFKGQTLSNILWSMPRGHIASAFRTTHSANNAKPGGEWAPYMRLEVNLERNRLYKISTSPLKYGQDAGGSASIRIVQSTGAVATIGSVTIDNVEIEDGHDGNTVMLSEYTQIGGAIVDGPSDDVVLVSYLLMFKAHRGQFGMRASGVSPARLMIEDMGPLRNAYTGIHLDTTATNGVPPAAPPAKSTHTTTWDCNWIRSFDGNGNTYNYNTSRGYQGLSPAGYGNMKTVMKFPDMTGTLSGSIIHEIKVYLYFEHWYYNAGGTARIGLAGTGDPTTYGGQNPIVESGGWPKPGGRWVTIPTNHYYGFQTGTYRGITLEGDGTYGTYGIVHPGKIEITYTK